MNENIEKYARKRIELEEIKSKVREELYSQISAIFNLNENPYNVAISFGYNYIVVQVTEDCGVDLAIGLEQLCKISEIVESTDLVVNRTKEALDIVINLGGE